MTNQLRRVLLVEDEVLVAMLAADSLVELGFEVVEAGSGAKALEIANADIGQFAVAIVDLGLPDGPGEAVIEKLKVLRPDLPIIVASGRGSHEQDARFGGFKNLRMMPKPYDFKALSAALAALGLASRA